MSLQIDQFEHIVYLDLENTLSESWIDQKISDICIHHFSLTTNPDEIPAHTISHSIKAIVVDLDSFSKMSKLDTWSVERWRATLNHWVTKFLKPNTDPPRVIGITNEASWNTAKLGARLGAKDLFEKSDFIHQLTSDLESNQPKIQKDSDAPSTASLMSAKKETLIFSNPHKNNAEGFTSETKPTPSAQIIPFPIEGLDGQSIMIENIKNVIRRSAPLSTPILIQGPIGSGKERIAKIIHSHSRRSNHAFVILDCASLTLENFDEIVFGTLKKSGVFRQAHNGTLYLHEVAELRLDLQHKLMSSLDNINPNETNLRFISSSHHNLEELIQNKKFREDLYYKIKVIDIELPALHERKTDIPEIIKALMIKISRRQRQKLIDVDSSVLEKFLLYSWPGNIRELENVLEQGATFCWAENRNLIKLTDLPEKIQFATMQIHNTNHLKEVVKKFEKEYIASTIRRLGGSKELTADSLGLSLATLYRKIGT